MIFRKVFHSQDYAGILDFNKYTLEGKIKFATVSVFV